MLTLWGRANAFNVQKVMWAADEVGVQYERKDAGRGYGIVDTDAYAKLNPNRRVPTIEDDGLVLWESNVIVRYLCARYGEGDLYPADLLRRVEAERWMDWQSVDVHKAYLPAYNVLSRARDDFTLEQAEASFHKTIGLLAILDARLAESPYVAGDYFTMGDIPLGIQMHDLIQIGREVPGLANAKRWYAQLRERPGARAAMSVRMR